MDKKTIEKEAIIAEYLTGAISYRKLGDKYGIDFRLIHSWLIKVWFSASTFVVKIATFAKPENVIGHFRTTEQTRIDRHERQ